MTGILLTQNTTPVIGQAAWILGKIMDIIYRVLYSGLGIQNIGFCIIILTIIVYLILTPTTYNQQKFSRMSSAMNPEIQKIQKKYQGKKDNESMAKMQEETQLVYEKYGVSPTGGCLGLFIQLPILWAMYYVIRVIPAYVSDVKAVYMPLIEKIQSVNGWQNVMETIGAAKPVLMSPEKFDYTQANTLVDVLYKFQASSWEELTQAFPDLSSTIASTRTSIEAMTSFLGISIAEAPLTIVTSSFRQHSYGLLIVALLIPVLAGLTQYLNIKISMATTKQPAGNDQMTATMNSMNTTMPLLSVFMGFTLPAGLGLYWIASAVVRTVQLVIINNKLNKIPMDELIKVNMEKAAKKREAKGHVESKQVAQAATKKTKTIKKSLSAEEEKALQNKLDNARNNAKAGSLASKANMVKKYNETK